MRRLALAVPLLLIAGLTHVASAAPKLARSGVIVDPRGDWQVAGEDIVKVTVTGVGKRLTVDVELAAAVPTQPSYYQVQMTAGCHNVLLAAHTANGAVVQDQSLPGEVSVSNNFYSEFACQPDATGSYQSDDNENVVPTVKGNHLIWNVRYLKGMKRGVVVKDLAANSNRGYLNPIVYVGRNGVGPTVGDHGSSATLFVLG